MERPNDIPQDVWDRAAVLFGHEARARAILAERERCAKQAEHYTSAKMIRRARELNTQEVYEIKIFARLIAAAIRAGGAQ